MVKFPAQRPQAHFYIAKATPVSELGKGHRQILIPTREASRPRISAVPSDTTVKLAIRQETQQLTPCGPGSWPIVRRRKARPWRPSPFKSRQGKKRRKPLTVRALSESASTLPDTHDFPIDTPNIFGYIKAAID